MLRFSFCDSNSTTKLNINPKTQLEHLTTSFISPVPLFLTVVKLEGEGRGENIKTIPIMFL